MAKKSAAPKLRSFFASEEFLAYWRWLNETDEADRENICAACRRREELGNEGE